MCVIGFGGFVLVWWLVSIVGGGLLFDFAAVWLVYGVLCVGSFVWCCYLLLFCWVFGLFMLLLVGWLWCLRCRWCLRCSGVGFVADVAGWHFWRLVFVGALQLLDFMILLFLVFECVVSVMLLIWCLLCCWFVSFVALCFGSFGYVF